MKYKILVFNTSLHFYLRIFINLLLYFWFLSIFIALSALFICCYYMSIQAYILCKWIILFPPPSPRKINFTPTRKVFLGGISSPFCLIFLFPLFSSFSPLYPYIFSVRHFPPPPRPYYFAEYISLCLCVCFFYLFFCYLFNQLLRSCG